MLKFAAKKLTRAILANPRAVATARGLLRPFPRVEEEVRVWAYLLKKKLATNQNASTLLTDESARKNSAIAPGEHQILIDISELVLRDVHTGIQRVVRSILQEMLNKPPTGYVVEPVFADADGQLHYARIFLSAMIGKSNKRCEDSLVSVNPGDIFYCPDLHLTYPFPTLTVLQQHGLRVIFTIYDIIALNNQDFFPRAYKLGFSDWFAGVMMVADAIVCDSRAVAHEVKTWLEHHPGQRDRPLPIGYFHLGADIEASRPSLGEKGEGAEILAACELRPTLLMVGTLESRKGHAQVLAALESLWGAEVDLNLVIIGKEGWCNQRLARQLRVHPEHNRRLFWLEGASDTLLLQLYAHSSALLAASLAEGFGLPLIEAARQGLPIIARDIPVFREVAGEHAYYFQGERPEELAQTIQRWLLLFSEGTIPTSRSMPWFSWAESTRQLLDVLIANKFYTSWMPYEDTIYGDL